MRTHQLTGATLGVAALLLATSACGGGSDKPEPKLGPDASDSPSASASASSPAAAPKPTVPPVTSNTAAGRKAFAAYFVKSLNYAYAANDASPVTDVAATGKGIDCTMCSDLEKYLGDQKAKGQHLEPSALPVKKIFETAKAASNVWVLDVQSSAPARADVDESGTKVKSYPAKNPFIVEVGVAWENNSYRVTGWKAGENS